MNKVILFDIDYTLFDTTKFKKIVSEILTQKLSHLDPQIIHNIVEEVYSNVRQFGSFDPKKFAEFFVFKFPGEITEKAVEEIWYQQEIIKQAIYQEVIPTLRNLQKNQYMLGIFSSGQTEFQLAKISLVEDFFHKDHIHIAAFKEEKLEDLLREYKEKQIVLVDDYVEVLYKAKNFLPDITAVWMKRGKFAEKAKMPQGFFPDATITDLSELLPLLDNEGTD